MNDAGIRSAALSEAELQSERLRILAVMVFFAVFTLIVIIRLFGFRTATLEDPRVWCSLILVLIVVAFEYWMLRRVNLALDTGERVPTRFWVFTTVLETALPALGLAFLPNAQIEFAYRPLASPALLVFFILIIMSVLRLSPAISVLAGCSACVSYLCAALYLGWTPPSIGEVASFTQSAVTLNAITLLMGGVVGAAVSGQVRKHSMPHFEKLKQKGSSMQSSTTCRSRVPFSSHSYRRPLLGFQDSISRAGTSQLTTPEEITSTGRPLQMAGLSSALPMLQAMASAQHYWHRFAEHMHALPSGPPKI
jgi:hypothetical protein